MARERYAKQDEQLYYHIQRMQQGYVDSFNEIYNLSGKYIYKIINDIVKEHHTTEDMLQETFIKIYNNICSLQSPQAYYVWAGRIATNLCISYIRKNSKEVLQTSIDDGEGNEEFTFDTVTDDNEMFIPESVMENKEHQRMIGAVIDGLSVEQKLAVQCFYFEEMSVKEIAEAMGCSEGTIKSRLNYARKAIKQEVLHIEKTQGTKLYSFAAVPVLLLLYRGYAQAAVASAATAGVGGALTGMSATGGGVAAASGTTGATGMTAVTATTGTASAAGVSGKVVAIIASIVIALSGIVGGGVIAFNSCEGNSDKEEPLTNEQEQSEQQSSSDIVENVTDDTIDGATDETTETGKCVYEGDYKYEFYSNDDGVGWKVSLNVDDYKTRISFGDILESIDGVSVTDISDLFNGCINMIESPKIPETVTNMSYTFAYCESLVEAPELPLGLRYLDSAFTCCTSLVKATEIPAGVESLTETFYRCISLEETPFIQSGVKDMRFTFEGCEKLSKIANIPDSVTDMTHTFFNCYSLQEVPELSASLTDMTYTFYGCINLIKAPDIPGSVTIMNDTFGACKSLTEAPKLPENVTDMVRAFAFCVKLVEAPEIPSGVINMEGTFSGCVSLVKAPAIPVGVMNLKRTFYDCDALTGIVIIDANPTEYEECFDMVYLKKQNIEVGGASAILEEIKATAEKEN